MAPLQPCNAQGCHRIVAMRFFTVSSCRGPLDRCRVVRTESHWGSGEQKWEQRGSIENGAEAIKALGCTSAAQSRIALNLLIGTEEYFGAVADTLHPRN